MAGGLAETADGYLVFLLEFGEVDLQRLDAHRTEEDQHVVVLDLDGLSQVGGNGAEQHGLGVVQLGRRKLVGSRVGADVGTAIEVLLVLVFLHDFNQVAQGLVAKENLPFPILHITLEIKGCRFVDAEILECLRNRVAHFLGHAEEMVDGVTARKDDARVFRQFDMLLAKLACGDVIKFDKLLEPEVHAILFHHVGIGCFRNVGRLWL